MWTGRARRRRPASRFRNRNDFDVLISLGFSQIPRAFFPRNDAVRRTTSIRTPTTCSTVSSRGWCMRRLLMHTLEETTTILHKDRSGSVARAADVNSNSRRRRRRSIVRLRGIRAIAQRRWMPRSLCRNRASTMDSRVLVHPLCYRLSWAVIANIERPVPGISIMWSRGIFDRTSHR